MARFRLLLAWGKLNATGKKKKKNDHPQQYLNLGKNNPKERGKTEGKKKKMWMPFRFRKVKGTIK